MCFIVQCAYAKVDMYTGVPALGQLDPSHTIAQLLHNIAKFYPLRKEELHESSS